VLIECLCSLREAVACRVKDSKLSKQWNRSKVPDFSRNLADIRIKYHGDERISRRIDRVISRKSIVLNERCVRYIAVQVRAGRFNPLASSTAPACVQR